MMILVIIILFIACFLWVAGVYIVNDFSLPTEDVRKFKHVLFVYPHADDEGGGLIHVLFKNHIKTTLLILTKGERGTFDAHLDTSLKQIRTAEAKSAAKIYGLTTLIQEDFGDGQLQNKRKKLIAYIDAIILQKKPDLIITYDLAGAYGHPDHIVVSEVITELLKQKYNHTTLWYSTFPKKIFNIGTFPTQMANDQNFMKKRAPARFRVFIGLHVIQKVQAIYAYKSQFRSFREAVPYPFIPLWFVFSLFIYDYFDHAK